MRPRRIFAIAAAGSLLAATASLAAPHAGATSPDQSLSGLASSFWQTNNSVDALATTGGVLYAGGLFTSVRPPGDALGTGESARTYLAAFTTANGVATSFAPTLNGAVLSLAISPDGTKLYAGGQFTTVDGVTRNHFAAFDLPAGNLDPTWNPNADNNGHAIATYGNDVYLGGTFSQIGGVGHRSLAEVDGTTGALIKAFHGVVNDGDVQGIAIPTDGSRVVATGTFNTADGVATNHGLAGFDPTTGALTPWAWSGLSNTRSCVSQGAAITISGDVAYVAADGIQGGCDDGDFAVNIAGGTEVWNSVCQGATAALIVLNGVLYKGSHMHDCAYDQGNGFGGFVGGLSLSTFVYHRLIAQSLTDGSFEHWTPNTNGGESTKVGPLAFATDGTNLYLGGDFTTVNNKAQQGLSEFTPTNTKASPAKPTVAPVATPSGPGDITITLPAESDKDTGTLTYSLYRNDGHKVGAQSVESWIWAQPTVRFTDTGLTPGTAYTYHYTIKDGTTTSSASPESTAVTAVASIPDYQTTVSSAAPSLDWRLDDTGTTAADASGRNATGSFVGGVTTGAPGAIGTDTAVTLDGSTGYVTSNSAIQSTSAFTESAWFKTSSYQGGSIIGNSTTQTGPNGTSNDAVYLDNDGQINFDIVPSSGASTTPPLRSATSYNDGRWHQVVATYTGSAASLYVDGQLVASGNVRARSNFAGYLRAGDENLAAVSPVFGTNPTNLTSPNDYFLNGSLDEVAFYPRALSAAQVAAQWQGGAIAP